MRGDAIRKLRIASIFILPLVAWLPLLALTAVDRKLLPGSVGTPFLLDLSAHIRLLLALPLLLLAGVVAAARMRPTLQQFLARSLVPETSIERFKEAVGSAFALGDSTISDLVIVAFIYGLDLLFVWRTNGAINASTWRSTASGGKPVLTPAGIYYVYASIPMFQFILLRWYYRLLIWGRFLLQTAGLDLRLVPTNPDRVGGLGFLLLGTQAFSVFAMAHGTLLAAWLSTRVLIKGVNLNTFDAEIAAIVVFVLCITIGPLLVFTGPLLQAKQRGIEDYGALATRYSLEFDDKWVRERSDPQEPLVGSADIQSLADMGGSYDLVRSMRIVPITPQMILGFAAVTLLPVAPLVLSMVPLSAIVSKLVNILF